MLQFFPGLGMQIGVFLERARALAELKEVDAQFRLLADTTSDAVLTIDGDSTILFANSAVERVFGYKPAEVVGKKLTMLMAERFRARHEAGILRCLNTGKRKITWEGIELSGLRKDGSEIPLLIAFGEFLRGQKRIFTGFAREIRAGIGVGK